MSKAGDKIMAGLGEALAYQRGFRAGIEAAEAEIDAAIKKQKSNYSGFSLCTGKRVPADDEAAVVRRLQALKRKLRALPVPAAPEPLFAPREYEADDFGPIGDAARRICSYAEGEVRKNVYRAAKRELAALQPAPEPSEAKRMAAIEDRAILEMRRYTANGAPCSQPWGGCDVD